MVPGRRALIPALLALLVIVAAPQARAAQEPSRFIETLADRAIDTAVAEVTYEERLKRFRELFVSSFDLPEIARFVLGRHWRTASPQQQQAFLDVFEDLTVLTWAQRFKDYGGEDLQVLGTSAGTENGIIVESRITRPSGPPIAVAWRLRETPQGLRIVDIVVDGVSMAITERSQYASAVRTSGGMDGLLDSMRQRATDMRAARAGNGT